MCLTRRVLAANLMLCSAAGIRLHNAHRVSWTYVEFRYP